MVNDILHRKIINQTKEQVKPYRVLSLDGGGMRGLYTASVLQSLVNRFSKPNHKIDKDIGKGFDLIVGTSTGGILACGLASGVPIRNIIELYSKKGKKIFTNPFPFDWKIKKLWWAYQNKNKPANSNKALTQELQSIFSDKTMGQIYNERKVGLCITSINLIDYSPRVFKTPHNLLKNADNNRKLIDVCLAASAAPIIFPIANIPDPERENIYENFVDGGLWANSPISVALIEAISCSGENQKIEIVSIGTCPAQKGEVVKNSNRGLFQWQFGIKPMELSMESQSKASHNIADFLCVQLKKLGRKVTIHRLKQTVPSVEQAKFLSLDQANKQTCDLLIKLGKKDGEAIYGEITRKDKYNNLKTIFTNLPNIKGGN